MIVTNSKRLKFILMGQKWNTQKNKKKTSSETSVALAIASYASHPDIIAVIREVDVKLEAFDWPLQFSLQSTKYNHPMR